MNLPNRCLTRAEALALLQLPIGSSDYYALLCAANRYARAAFGGKGAIFAQIGLDAQPCPVNCRFCSLAADLFDPKSALVKQTDDILMQARQLVSSGAQELFLMATAAYDFESFLELGSRVRAVLPKEMPFVANVGDFDLPYARALKKTGFTGVYHICRLGEGEDTEVSPARRLQTMDAVRDAGLELYYCVEPIGPEHSDDALLDEMFRAKSYPVSVMAVMKRVAVPGSRLEKRGEISAARLAQIAAVTVLTVRPRRAMGVHEPDELCLMAGANQIYAESGVNPRDLSLDTEKSRGFSVFSARKLLANAQWSL